MVSPEQTNGINVREFLSEPNALMQLLMMEGALEFPISPGGLFVAGGVSDALIAGVTGMDTLGWPRDTSLVSENILVRSDDDQGDIEKVCRAGRAFMTILHLNETRMNDAIVDQDAPPLPSRVEASTLKNDDEQRNQFDSAAYLIRLPSILAIRGLLKLSRDDLAIMEKAVRYLQAREYWGGKDEGIWEETSGIHNSSRGVVISGLVKTARAFEMYGYEPKVDMARVASRGRYAFNSSIWEHGEMPTSIGEPGRFFDVSHMVLAEGIRLFGDNFKTSDILVRRVLKLVGEIASKRYFGDTYNTTGFRELFTLEERTTQGEGRQEKRDSLVAQTLQHGSEAQWPMPEGYQASYWGRRAEWSHRPEDLLLQYFFLRRNVGQFVRAKNGLRVPELFYKPTLESQWVAGDHIPLLWAQATTVGALMQLQRTGQAIADYLAR